MKPSPVIFSLLVAATLAVYAVVCSWVASEPFPTPAFAWATFDALTLSQLSLVCMWSAFRSAKTVWSRIAPVAAVLMATMLVAGVINDPVSYWGQFWACLPSYGLHVALLLAALWVLQRTNFWQRRFGTIRAWRFSLAELLTVMTAVAVLTAAMRESPFLGDDGWLIFAFIASTVSLALASIVLWSASVHWLLRLAGTLCVAILLGIAIGPATDFGWSFTVVIGADYLIQALVLSIWLGAGASLPAEETTAAVEPPSTIP